MNSVWGVKCNCAFPEKAMRRGALCWVSDINTGWGGERLQLYARARDGRLIKTWRPAKRLENFRAAWVPEHMRHDCWTWESKEEAQRWIDSMSGRHV